MRKFSGWSGERFTFSHYRDKDQAEVDIVIEDQQGKIIGIEVKAAATVTAKDFIGLKRLADVTGKAFVAGVVLYDHEQTVGFGDRL